MIFWVDEQLSRRLALWLAAEFGVEAVHVSELGLSASPDPDIFEAARAADAVLITKDGDFVQLLERLGAPPRLVWLTTGNSSNAYLQGVFKRCFRDVLAAFEAGETFIEIAN